MAEISADAIHSMKMAACQLKGFSMKDLDWNILVSLYEKRSMTKAAEALYMSQSALTKRVRNMEDEWHTEIVKRSSKGVTFTEEGMYLVRKANVMLDFIREIDEHFEENNNTKELLRIGIPTSFARLHMSALMKEYIAGYNRLLIKTFTSSSDVIMEKLIDGTVDIGIICGDYPYTGEKTCLFEEEMYIIAPKGIRLEDIVNLPLIESYFNPLVKMTIDQWWKSHFGSRPHESHKVPYAEIAIEMVENGLGITFVFGSDWRVDQERSQRIPVYNSNGEPVRRKVWMMLSDRCFHSQQIMDFITMVEKRYQVNT